MEPRKLGQPPRDLLWAVRLQRMAERNVASSQVFHYDDALGAFFVEFGEVAGGARQLQRGQDVAVAADLGEMHIGHRPAVRLESAL